MAKRALRLHPKLEAALKETGLPYSLEHGSRHVHLRLAGHLTLAMSRASCMNPRACQLKADIRMIRHKAEELKNG